MATNAFFRGKIRREAKQSEDMNECEVNAQVLLLYYYCGLHTILILARTISILKREHSERPNDYILDPEVKA